MVCWLLFAAWQRSEYIHQRELIHNSLLSQAESLSDAVASGLQSHRWFSPYVQQQLPETLGVLARSRDVVAIGLMVDGEVGNHYFSGDQTSIDFSLPVGEHSDGNVLQLVTTFTVHNEPPRMLVERSSVSGDLSDSVAFKSIVALDRSTTNAQISREARNRILVLALGTLLIFAVGAVWQFTVSLAQSQGVTRLLQAETRHLRELGQAAAGLAHETRNPLGLIRGWTQRLLETGLPTKDQEDQAEAVLEECDRVTARINQFLAFARQDEVDLEPLALEELVAELETLLQFDLQAHGLKLETCHDASVPKIYADRDQLRQVLFNLIQNAISFAPKASTIRISSSRSKQGKVRLEVADQGPGADADIVGTIFDPYVTKRQGGTGLGLSIVRRIAIAHGWDVGYSAGETGGATFWIDGIRSV
jgi:signal transduction histidine kinase